MKCINGERFKGISQIDFMSVDCEGCELNFLKDFPFHEIIVGVIIVEFHPIFKAHHDDIKSLLKQNGFEFEGSINDGHHDYSDGIFALIIF